MATAVLRFHDHRGKSLMARTLLDSCSNVNLMTQKFLNHLQLPIKPCFVNIGAVDNTSAVSEKYTTATFFSTYNNTEYKLNFLIVPKIVDNVPNETFPREKFEIPKNIKLADPQFHVPRSIDLLLASGPTMSSLAIGQIKLANENSKITLQKTSFGWVITGGSMSNGNLNTVSCNDVKLDQLLEKFLTVEDLDYQPVKSHDDVLCEEHYVKNTTRDISGRYTVRLPFRPGNFDLGSTKGQALHQFYTLEKKFKAKPSLQAEYEREMNGYIELGHMTLCEDDNDDGYYIPHHAVIKETSDTYKHRVVYNASAKSTTGTTLNENLLTGPTIQKPLYQQVLSFRSHPFVITADIEKMYRQVWVHPDDRKFQKIFWYHEGKVRTFTLNTVTFGVRCAPFLAIRTLHQLAKDEELNFPRASLLLRRDFYVDDFLSGADTLEDIMVIRDEMIQLLSRGGFVIRKWSSNHPSALENIDKRIFDLDCGIQGSPVKKTLGTVGDSQRDVFTYSVNLQNAQSISTKRKLLSQIAKVFDPLGLVGPLTFSTKTLIQECWRAKITWDESLPQDIHTRWVAVADQLPRLQEIAFPRYLGCPNPVSFEVHGFCDASMCGYGACLFIRSSDSLGNVIVRLACSKSKVASLTHHTIPRLELAGATLLKRLYIESKDQLVSPIVRTTFWSDSMIVLCWLKKAPHLLRTYEANRVADIQTLDKEIDWRHVRSKDNPADPLSRGQLPNELLNNSLWTSGPQWLTLSNDNWPQPPNSCPNELPGFKDGIVLITALVGSIIYYRFSDYGCLIRSIAYLLRWKRRGPLPSDIPNTGRSRRGIRYLTPDEIAHAELLILRLIQRENFSTELKLLNTTQTQNPDKPKDSSKSHTKFDELNPFIDDDGLIRVGGRLKHSDLLFNQKHPVLLPSNHHVSDLIILDAHHRNHHSGIQSTLYAIRQRFWILNGKNQIRHVLRRCVPCIRQRPKFPHAKMADLPEPRVVASLAFINTGVDFFGPIMIKEKKERNRTFIKGYG